MIFLQNNNVIFYNKHFILEKRTKNVKKKFEKVEFSLLVALTFAVPRFKLSYSSLVSLLAGVYLKISP